MKIWHNNRRARFTGFILAALLGALVLQCDFNSGRGIVMPSWHITLTIPLVSEFYGFRPILEGDETGTIAFYGDTLDTVNAAGDSVRLLLPDSNSLYPGGLYIGLSSDLPPVTLPQDLFRIPGQSPMALGIGPISMGGQFDSLEDGIHPEAVGDTLAMADMGFSIGAKTASIPSATCEVLDSVREEVINFTFGSDPTDLNVDMDVSLPGPVKVFTYSFPTNGDTCDACDPPSAAAGICTEDTTVESTDFVVVPTTVLPTYRQAFAILPDPSALPSGTPLQAIESVSIAAGNITSVIESQMPLNSSNVGLRVYTKKSSGDTISIHTHHHTLLPPYMGELESPPQNIPAELSTDLAGVRLYDSLVVEFAGTVEGSTTDTLHFPEDKDPFFRYNFEIDIDEFDSVYMVMADTSMAFNQPFNTTSSDPEGQSFSVDIIAATFEDNIDDPDTNRLRLSVSNNLGVDIITFRVNLLNFFEEEADIAEGEYETLEFAVPDGATVSDSLVLDGHHIASRDGSPIDSLEISTEVEFGSQDGVTAIEFPPPEDMNLDVAVSITPLRIGELEGMFDINFALTQQEQPLSMPGLVGGVTFGEAFLVLELDNQFGVEPGLGLNVTGFRGEDSVLVSLDPDSVTFEPGGLGDTVTTEIRISRQFVQKSVGDETPEIVQYFVGRDNIVDLMGLLPERVTVGGDAQISPEERSSIAAGATITGRWRFEIPFLLEVEAGGVEFLPSSYTPMAKLDSSTIESLVGSNGEPDGTDLLLSSEINTIISSDIGLGFGMEILVSDLPYFPFFSNQEGKAIVSADLDDDGEADSLDLNLDSLILHPVVSTLELLVPPGIVDVNTGLVPAGSEGSGIYSYSADFNLSDPVQPDTIGTFVIGRYAMIDTFLVARSDSGTFADVDAALAAASIDAPTVSDSLYILELNEDQDELYLIYTVSEFGELGWLIEDVDHFIATKFILFETINPALISLDAGIDVTAYMEFILNSEPMFSASEDTTQ